MDIEETVSKCLDSEGYLAFFAYLTEKKDKAGASIIDFQYSRHHFSLEDSKEAFKQLRKFIEAEIDKLTETSDN